MIHYGLAALFLVSMTLEFVEGDISGGLGWMNAAIWISMYGYHNGGRK